MTSHQTPFAGIVRRRGTWVLLLLFIGLACVGGSYLFKTWYFRGGLQDVEMREERALAKQIEASMRSAELQARQIATQASTNRKAGFRTFNALARYTKPTTRVKPIDTIK